MHSKRNEVLEVLRKRKMDFAARYGVRQLGIFGSLARDEARETSDIDIVVELDTSDVFAIVHLKEEIEASLAFAQPVDLVQYRERMNPLLKKRIDQEAVYV